MYQWIVSGIYWVFSLLSKKEEEDMVVVHDFTTRVKGVHDISLTTIGGYQAVVVSKDKIGAGDLVMVTDENGEQYTLIVTSSETPFGREDLYLLEFERELP